ncbi:hypothetical protein KM043_001743 [Ampulex compressa]|nr:hypothetical protein KM043_001743 [Ampulex compressa]
MPARIAEARRRGCSPGKRGEEGSVGGEGERAGRAPPISLAPRLRPRAFAHRLDARRTPKGGWSTRSSSAFLPKGKAGPRYGALSRIDSKGAAGQLVVAEAVSSALRASPAVFHRRKKAGEPLPDSSLLRGISILRGSSFFPGERWLAERIEETTRTSTMTLTYSLIAYKRGTTPNEDRSRAPECRESWGNFRGRRGGGQAVASGRRPVNDAASYEVGGRARSLGSEAGRKAEERRVGRSDGPGHGP